MKSTLKCVYLIHGEIYHQTITGRNVATDVLWSNVESCQIPKEIIVRWNPSSSPMTVPWTGRGWATHCRCGAVCMECCLSYEHCTQRMGSEGEWGAINESPVCRCVRPCTWANVDLHKISLGTHCILWNQQPFAVFAFGHWLILFLTKNVQNWVETLRDLRFPHGRLKRWRLYSDRAVF